VIRTAIGTGVLALSLAVLAALVWCWWLAGHGRHRRPRHAPDLLASTEAVSVQAPPAPSVLPLREGVEEAGGADPDTVALPGFDRADFDHCPAEGRRTPHFLHSDGSRTCCRCETTTAGDQT
jgi:hypothetical protein